MSQNDKQVHLETSLGYALKEAASLLRSRMDAVLRPLGMSVPQYACLELLAQRPGLSNSQLARGTFVSRQSMNVLLLRLEREGFVTRPEQSPAGRILPVELTDLGHVQLQSASAAVRAVEDQMHQGLDERESAQLRALLGSCIASLSE